MGFNETGNKTGMAWIHLLQYRVVGSCCNESCTKEGEFLERLSKY